MKSFYLSKRKLQLLPAAIFLIALALAASTSAQTITTFDAPGAGTGFLQGTYGVNVSPSGAVTRTMRGTVLFGRPMAVLPSSMPRTQARVTFRGRGPTA